MVWFTQGTMLQTVELGIDCISDAKLSQGHKRKKRDNEEKFHYDVEAGISSGIFPL